MTLPDSPWARSHGSCGPPGPRSASLLRAAHPRHSTAIVPGLFAHPAWSPRIAEPLSTPRGAAASPQRPSASGYLNHHATSAVASHHRRGTSRPHSVGPSCLDSSHIPPGHPTSLSHCLPLAGGAAASPQRPGALYPAHADTSTSAPHGPPLHITGAVHTGLTLPGPTRSRDPRLYGPCAPKPKAIVDVPGLHQAVAT